MRLLPNFRSYNNIIFRVFTCFILFWR